MRKEKASENPESPNQSNKKPEKTIGHGKPGPGRPKGSRNFKQLYDEMGALLSQQMTLPGGTRKVTMSAKERMVLVRWALALKGDQHAMDRIEDRLDGSPAQVIRQTGGGSGGATGLNIRLLGVTKEAIEKMKNVEVIPKKEKPGAK
jgi:hypothetical protein